MVIREWALNKMKENQQKELAKDIDKEFGPGTYEKLRNQQNPDKQSSPRDEE